MVRRIAWLAVFTCALALAIPATSQATAKKSPVFSYRQAPPALLRRAGRPTADCHQAKRITIINQADVRPIVLARVENAIAAQSAQLRRAWGTPCAAFAPGGWRVYLKIGSTLAMPRGAYFNPAAPRPDGTLWIGQPYALVWTTGCTAACWSAYLSQEIVEMLVDPYQRTFSDGQAITTTGVVTIADEPLVEVADPSEQHTYWLDGATVADFTLPSYWTSGAWPYDWMRVLKGATRARPSLASRRPRCTGPRSGSEPEVCKSP
jgi:hypothetical protein